jgi:hypothetical protein
MITKEIAMTEATTTPVQMPERWDLVGDYDGYMVPMEEGDYVKVKDVEPLVAEINRIRAAAVMVHKIIAYMHLEIQEVVSIAKHVENMAVGVGQMVQKELK